MESNKNKLWLVSDLFYLDPKDGDNLILFIVAPDMDTVRKCNDWNVLGSDNIVNPCVDIFCMGEFSPSLVVEHHKNTCPDAITGGYTLYSISEPVLPERASGYQYRLALFNEVGLEGYREKLSLYRKAYFSASPVEGWKFVLERHGEFEVAFYVSPEWFKLIESVEV